MNETINTILERRSVRSYSPEQIKDDELNSILKAGLYAPSARNQQSWHFTVIQNKEIIDNLNKAAKEAMLKLDDDNYKKYAENENLHIFHNATTVIVVSGEKSATAPHLDCAAATQNMLLTAESLNIGTCWIGLVKPLFTGERAEEFAQKYSIPEGFELYYAITLGYKTTENESAPPRRENTINFIK